MDPRRTWILCALMACGLSGSLPARAHDVDGPNDCIRIQSDMGDAPEVIDAYPGVPGHFPTCFSFGASGTREAACVPISTLPGAVGTGYVINTSTAAAPSYWLGCDPVQPLGIDSDGDGKVNLVGAGSVSACGAGVLTDCAEAAFGMTFGQDECYGDDDAGLAAPPTLRACSAAAAVAFEANNCSSAPRSVYLNILVDMNHDGDWNDNFQCAASCAYEWAVKNQPIALPPGCNPLVSPSP